MKAATEAVFFISDALPSLKYVCSKFIRLKSLDQESGPSRESLPPHQIVTANPTVRTEPMVEPFQQRPVLIASDKPVPMLLVAEPEIYSRNAVITLDSIHSTYWTEIWG